METHNEYIDIQIPFTKPETMGYIPAKDLKSPIEPYNAEKDITKYTDIDLWFNKYGFDEDLTDLDNKIGIMRIGDVDYISLTDLAL